MCMARVPAALRATYDADSEESYLLRATTQHEAPSSELYQLAKVADSAYVFAKQGKSVHTHLWSLQQLLDSNSNLRELDPQIAAHLHQYKASMASVEQGLCNQLVILHATT